MPPLPKKRSTLPVMLTTKYTHIIFKTNAMIILILAYSARKESKVVKAPAPANSGKTNGTSVASLIGPWFKDFNIKNHFQRHQKNNKRTGHRK